MSPGELILKFCNVGVPVLLGGSDLPVSIGPTIFESISVEPYGCGMREMICVLLLLILSFGGCLAIRCTGFRFLGSNYHQLLVMFVCSLNQLLRYGVVSPDCYHHYYFVTQFFYVFLSS